MAIGFEYTLGVDEAASLANLQAFVDKIDTMEAKIKLDFEGDITGEAIDKLATKINQLNTNLSLDINEFRIDRQALQESLNENSKRLELLLKVKFDDMELQSERVNPGEPIRKNFEKELALMKDSALRMLNNLSVQMQKANIGSDIIDVNEIKKSIESLDLTTSSFKNIKGEIKEIKNDIAAWQQVIKLNNNLLANTGKVTDEIRAKMKDVNTSMKMDESEANTLKKTLELYQRRLKIQKDSVTMSRQFRDATEKTRQEILQEINALDISGNSVKELAQSYQEASVSVREFKSRLRAEDINANGYAFENLSKKVGSLVTQFFTLDKVFNLVEEGFRNSYQYILDLDNAYTDVAISMDITRGEFDKWTGTATEIARESSIATNNIMDMVKIYATAGEDISQIQSKLSGTAALQNITQFDTNTTTQIVNSVVNQFKLMEKEVNGSVGNMENVINYFGDALVNISNNLGIDNVKGIQEMANAIDDAGAIIESTGGSMEWFMAMTAKTAETMNMTGSEFGAAMRMIVARTLRQGESIEAMGESAEDAEYKMAKAEKALTSVGATIRGKTSDELLSIEEILGNVAGAWDDLSDSERQYVAEAMAGTQRSAVFINLMENYDAIQELQEKAHENVGALMEANAIRADSLENKLAVLKDTINRLFASFMNSEGLKSAIELLDGILNGVIKVVEAMDGNMLPLFIALGGVIGALKINSIIGLFTKLAGSMTTAAGATGTLTASVASLKTVLLGGLAGVAITAAIAGLVKWGQHVKEEKERIEGFSDAVADYKNAFTDEGDTSVSNLVSKYEEINRKLKDGNVTEEERIRLENEVAEVAGQLSGLGEKYKDVIDDQNSSLDEQVEKLENISQYDKRKAAISLYDETQLSDKQLSKLQDALGVGYTKREDYNNGWIEEFQRLLDENQAAMDEAISKGESIKKLEEERIGLQEDLNYWTQAQIENEEAFVDAYETLLAYQEAGLAMEELGFENTRDQSEWLDKFKGKYEEILGIKQEISNTSMNTADTDNDAETGLVPIQDMAALNEKYVEQVALLKEAKEMAEGLKDGLDFSEMQAMVNSDLFKGFAGNIANAAEVQEYLNQKISEMTDAANNTYAQMLNNDTNYWNEKVRNSEQWIQHEADTYNAILQIGAEALGISQEQFAEYINNKGLMREFDLSNATTVAEAENMMQSQTVQNILTYWQALVDDKNVARSVDLQNVEAFLNEQGVMEAQTINQLSSMWDTFYQNKVAAMTAQLTTLSNIASSAASLGNKVSGQVSSSFTSKQAFEAMASGAEKESASEATKAAAEYLNLAQQVEAMANGNPFSGFSVAFDGISAAAVGATDAIGGLTDALSAPGSGSGSGGKGGKGGSGSGKTATEKVVEDLEDLVDIYYEVDRAYKQCENALTLNGTKQQNRVGRELVNLYKEEINLLQQKTNILKDQMDIMNTEAEDLRKTLSSKGFTFDDEGNITNYANQLRYLTAQANSLSGEAKQKAIDAVKEVDSNIERYTSLMVDEIADVTNEWEDMVNQIKDVEREMAELVTDTQKDVAEAIEHYLNKRYDAVKNELEKEKDLYNKQYEDEEYQDSLADEKRKLDEIQQQITNLMRDSSEAGQLKLADLKQQYLDQQEAINEMIREHEKDSINDKFDDQLDSLDEELESLLSPENLINMINQAITNGFITIGDETVALQGIMDTWMNETGDGLYALGDILRTELCGNLEAAAGLMADMGITSLGGNNASSLAINGRAIGASILESAAGQTTVSGDSISIVFDAPLVELNGDASSYEVADIERMIKKAQDDMITKISKQLSKR